MKKKLLMLFLLAPISLFAQKHGQIDFFTLVQAMPAYKTAQTELEKISKDYEADLAEMQKELEMKLQKYQVEVTETTPENIRQRREQELQSLYKRYEQARQENSRALEQAKQERYQPVYLAVAEAIKAFAKEEGYVYIIDYQAAQSSYIFLNDFLNEDVTDEVATRLGVTLTTIAPTRSVVVESTELGINIDDNPANSDNSASPNEDTIYETADKDAEYPGGQAGLLNHIHNNIRYPSTAIDKNVQGVVILRFVVERDGSVGEVQVMKSLSAECDREAIRVIKTLRRFEPAKLKGVPVRKWFIVPIRYSMK
jgi:TonB family protein